mgnify:CR=1 FL=1
MEFTQVVENRYSCKNFSGRKVEAEKLQVILEAGRVAPTAKNLQEQRVYVVQSEEGLKKIDAVAGYKPDLICFPAAMALPPAWWWPLIKTMCLLTPARSGIPAWRMPLL